MALLSWLSSLPLAFMMGTRYSGSIAIAVSLITFLILSGIGGLFCYQYLRFVEYYYDFLGSTLLRSMEWVRNAEKPNVPGKEGAHGRD